MSRISDVTDGEGNPFDMDKIYITAISDFLLHGKDGFEMLKDPSIEILPPLVGEHDPSI